jgi:flagellar motor switch protein FliM
VLEVALETPLGPSWARLVLPESLLLAAPPPRTAAALERVRWRLGEARCELRIEAGRTALAREELVVLGPGDVVLFERFGLSAARTGAVSLRLGRGGFLARLDAATLTITDPYRFHHGGAMEHEPIPPKPAPDEPGAEQLLRELPVEVVCELGRVTMSGRELVELCPGVVIPVGRPLAGPVDLSVGGRLVARGELVDVEGEIGVRVTQMLD